MTEKQKLPITGGADKPKNAPLTPYEINRVLSAGKKKQLFLTESTT